MIKTKRKLVRPVKYRGYLKTYYSWKFWNWRIMFTVTWNVAPTYAKGTFTQAGYWYTDNSCRMYATPEHGGHNYTGTGETVKDALADIQAKIEANLSKNRDKPIIEALAAFKAETK